MNSSPEWADSVRCTNCGGLNASGAEWCGQCLKPLSRIERTPAAPPGSQLSTGVTAARFPAEIRAETPAPTAERPLDSSPWQSPAAAVTAEPVHHDMFTIQGSKVTWQCNNCGGENPVAENACLACGAPFRQQMETPLIFDPRQALHERSLWERLERSFEMIVSSLNVIRTDPELLLFPIIALIAMAAVGATFLGGFLTWVLRPGRVPSNVLWTGVLLMGAFYYVAYFIGIFCNAAVVGASMVRLRGGDPTIGDGFVAAGRRIGQIALWSLVAATVGIGLRMAEAATDRTGIIQRLAVQVAGVAWSALTFFVIPTILFEETGPFEGLTRSARLFKSRWRETFIGQIGIGLGLTLVSAPFVVLTVVSARAQAWPGAIIGGLFLLIISVIGATLSGVFNSALYHYAKTGEALPPFSKRELQGTFHARRFTPPALQTDS